MKGNDMIHITHANEPIEVKNICATIYSQPGLGKTSLAFTTANPLLLDFDKGSYRAANRKDVVQIASWDDVANITEQDVSGFDTIILDTVGKALDFLAADIIKAKPAHSYGGVLNPQGWGQLGRRFRAFLKLLNGFGKDVILISHMDEQKDGDMIKERLKIQGGSKDLVLTDSDVIARISIWNKDRHLVFSPTEASFGKDPANVGDVVIPHHESPAFQTCLADIITDIKASLNKLSEDQVAFSAEVQWFSDTLPGIDTPSGINDLLSRAKMAGREVSLMVMDRAKAMGFDFDAATRQFVDPDADIPEETPEGNEE